MSAPTIMEQLAGLELEAGELIERHRPTAEDFSKYANDPVGFIRDVLKESSPGPWSAQVEIGEAVRDHTLVVVRGCNSAGKDWMSARLALWWVYAMDGLALVTGPTQRQVREIVMGEVARAFHRSGRLPGDLFQLALRIEGERRGILAFTSSEASRLTGFHAPRVMGIITEAQGVEDFCYEGLLSCATGAEDRILAVGNPLAPSGRFYDVSKSGTWKAIKVAASDHPNVKEGRTVIPGAVSPQFCERIAVEYGRGSGTYKSRVEGEFPDSGEESLFRRSWLAEAAARDEDPEWVAAQPTLPLVVAVDPARYGPDSTSLAVRRGPRLTHLVTWRGKSTMETVDRVIEELNRAGVRPGTPGAHAHLPPEWRKKLPKPHGHVVVDAVGIGAGVVDRLAQLGYNVTAYNGGQFTTTRDRDKYLNERARSHWTLRKLLEDGEISLPRNTKLFDELMAVNWTPTADGKIQIERKDALKGRLGRSPDLGDAVVMAFSGVTRVPFGGMVESPWG